MVKNLSVNAEDAGDAGSIPGLGRSPGGGHGNPLQCSCLENPMDRETWWATVHGVAKNRTRLKRHTHIQESAAPLFLIQQQLREGRKPLEKEERSFHCLFTGLWISALNWLSEHPLFLPLGAGHRQSGDGVWKWLVMGYKSLTRVTSVLIYRLKWDSGHWWNLRSPPGAVIPSSFWLSELSFPALPLCWICRILLIVIFILNFRLSKISSWKQCSHHSALSPGECCMETFHHKISK